MAKVGERGWLGMTWPKEYGGSEGDGVYEYLLNEALARRGAPQIGKGVGIIGKTLIRYGCEKLKEEFLPEDPAQRGRVRGRLQRAQRRVRRGVHAAQGRPSDGDGWRAQRPEDVDHVGALRRVVLGGRPHRPRRPQAPRHHAVPRADGPPRPHHHGPSGRWATSAPTRCSSTTCSCPTTTWSASSTAASSTSPRRSTSSASRCSRTRQIEERLRIARRLRASTATVDGEPLEGRSGGPPPHRPASPPRARSPGCSACGSCTSRWQRRRPAPRRGVRVQAVRHRAVEAAGRRLDGHRRARHAAARRHRGGPDGRAGPSRPTATPCIDTIGGGTSEVQKNIIATRKLGLPKNF